MSLIFRKFWNKGSKALFEIEDGALYLMLESTGEIGRKSNFLTLQEISAQNNNFKHWYIYPKDWILAMLQREIQVQRWTELFWLYSVGVRVECCQLLSSGSKDRARHPKAIKDLVPQGESCLLPAPSSMVVLCQVDFYLGVSMGGERVGRGRGLGDGGWEDWGGGGGWEVNNKTPAVAGCGHPNRHLKVMGLKFSTKILLGCQAPGSPLPSPIVFSSFVEN